MSLAREITAPVILVAIADIKIGRRHRRDLGDIEGLAESIRSEGLLQSIGITGARELVFGRRRIEAYKLLGRTTIPAHIVRTSIVAGEYAENEIRKEFTPSERIAIHETLQRKPLGDQRRSEDLPTVSEAAKLAGFGNERTARQARHVVEHGTQELVAAMDKGDLSIDAAALVAGEPPERQQEILGQPETERRRTINTLGYRAARNTPAPITIEEAAAVEAARATAPPAIDPAQAAAANQDGRDETIAGLITIEREFVRHSFVETVRTSLAAPDAASDLAREFLGRLDRHTSREPGR